MSEVRRRGPPRLHLVAMGFCLALVGCQVPLSRAQPSPSASAPASAGGPRLAAADARLFRGDYDGAEAAYRSLIAAEEPGASAHLSTLLAYEGRFDEAVAEAQAGVSQHADSDSLARLTRALDWAEQVDAAVQAGARAIAARPVEPLAHVFYSEALSDAGRFDAAERELTTAENAGSRDPYVQAEIDREWSNLDRSRGDPESELNRSELAVRAQPGFPERQLDVIRFYYGNQRPQSAQALDDRLAAAFSKNYRVLVGLADAALIGGDAGRAESLYQAATQVQPGGPEASIGQAELAILVNHDFGGAHDLLLAALRQSPTSSAVYEFVRTMDLLVLNRDPAADLGSIAPQRPGDLAAARKAALDLLNGRRAAVGLPNLVDDPALDDAAEAHAYFYLFNLGQSQLAGTGIVTEDPSLHGFTGANALDRARHFHFAGAQSVEVADNVVTSGGTVVGAINSVQHRFQVLDRAATAAGYGQARIGALAISVLDVGSSTPAGSGLVPYPADGQADVPAAFTGLEVPDPLPQGAITPAGYPISLEAGDSQHLSVTSARLVGPDGKEIPGYALAPGQALGANQWAMVARQPLRPGARYTAEVTGTIDGANFTQHWSFTVAGA